jgi:Mrp family chromosome partitioning ATPase
LAEHRAFGIENTRGLSDILSGRTKDTSVIKRLAHPNLWFLPSGPIPSNPAELLGSAQMNAFMTNASHGPFDWIIVDTPPVMPVTDALIVTPWASGVVFVIGSEMTRRRVGQRHAARGPATLAQRCAEPRRSAAQQVLLLAVLRLQLSPSAGGRVGSVR